MSLRKMKGLFGSWPQPATAAEPTPHFMVSVLAVTPAKNSVVETVAVASSPEYDSRTKRRPASVATSFTTPGRLIGRPDGPDRATLCNFAQTPFHFVEI